MKSLRIEPTAQTPRVDFSAETGVLKIEGRSWPEDITQFYTILSEWMNAYVDCAAPQTDFHVTLEYFNSSSSKMIYRLFMKLLELVDAESKVTVHWKYQSNDEEMLEVGKEYHAALNCPSDLFEFKFVQLN